MTADKHPHDEPHRTYNLLIYGIDKKGLTGPVKPIVRTNYSLTFQPFSTGCRFNDFDGVILFQGIFEEIERGTGGYGSNAWTKVACDKQQLDKRRNEFHLLLEKQGFICFILCKRFVDEADYGANAKTSDLAKVCMPFDSFYRKNFANRISPVIPKRNEFNNFLKLYGAACSYFEWHGEDLDLQTIATVNARAVGLNIGGRVFFVPALVPDAETKKIEEYFCLLADALTSTVNKLAIGVPEWVNAFRFAKEQKLLERHVVLLEEIIDVEGRLATFERFKRILVTDGDQLVDAVADVLKIGFGFQIDNTDEHREDLKIVGLERNPLVLLEVKGTNAGVKREHVNQADSHRERAQLSGDFPTVLIENTHIKNARTLSEKDKPVPGEQIAHAARNNVLVLRSLDLLGLLELVNNGTMTSESVLGLLRQGGGWLRVWGAPPELLKQ